MPKEIELDSRDPKMVNSMIRSGFSEAVRRERRNLLLLSSVSIFVAYAEVRPAEATILGIKLEHLGPGVVYGSLLVSCLYFLTSYWIYASSEYREAKVSNADSQKRGYNLLDPPFWFFIREKVRANALYQFWLFFEFVLPRVIGVIAVLYLICKLYRLHA